MTSCFRKPFSVLAATFLVAVVAGLSGCGSGGTALPPPSSADARKVFENTDPRIKSGAASVVHFWELGGRDRVVIGVRRFSMDYQAELEYLKDDLPTKKGERKKHEGTLEFRETEKGWKGADGVVY